MEVLQRGIYNYLQGSFYLLAFLPIPRVPLVNFLLRLCWLAYLFGAMFLMFYWRLNGGDTSIGGLVGTALFVCNDFANMVTIFESHFKYSKYQKLLRLQYELDELLERHLQWHIRNELKRSRIVLRISVIFLIHCFCEALRSWISVRTKGEFSPAFYYTIPITHALKWRYMQIIVTIMEINVRVELIKRSILQLTVLNKPRHKYSTDIWRAYTRHEYDTVNGIRLFYGRIHDMFQMVNECFGWSILVILLTSMFDFVCNAFWTYSAHKNESFEKYLFNGSTSVSLGTLVAALFWYTDASRNHSRYIGCLIFKLVKPLGNKRYNDLVSEFSLQTLHQQFAITAKDFFQLNLNSLGSMVAAIVTYLVILIQFMLSERVNKDKIEPSLGTVEEEAMTTPMFFVDNSTATNSLFFKFIK